MTRRSRLGALAVAAVAVTAGAGCSEPRETTTSVASAPSAPSTPAEGAVTAPPTESALPPVALPDLSSTSVAVRAQIQTRYASLASLLAGGGVPARGQASSYGDLGNYLLAATFFDEAALCYSHAEALEPGEARWPYLRGHAVLRNGDRAAAALAFERAVALQADLPSLVWLGDTYLDLGRVDAAQGAFVRALRVAPESAAALFGLGRVALARGAYAEAVASMEHALRVDPRASAVNYPLAMAYRGAGQRDKAEPLLQRRGAEAPALDDPLLQRAEVLLDSAVSHEGLGMAALRRQDWPAAVQAFRRGLDVAPRDASLRYWMATALLASGDAAGAEREFRTIVRDQPDFAKAHFSLGAMLDQRGQKADALREYEAAVRTAPNMPEARLRLADTLRLQGQLAAASTQYEQAVALDPTIAEAWVGGAQALLATGQRDAANAWLERARHVHPTSAALAELDARTR